MAMPAGGGKGPGCGCGMMKGAPKADSAAHKKFLGETMSLRQEIMNKQFEIQKEYVKETPDQAVMTKLKGELDVLHKQLMDARTKAGLPTMPRGHMGHGMMKGGMGPGCNMPDCPVATEAPAKPEAK